MYNPGKKLERGEGNAHRRGSPYYNTQRAMYQKATETPGALASKLCDVTTDNFSLCILFQPVETPKKYRPPKSRGSRTRL